MSKLQQNFLLMAAEGNMPDATRNAMPISSCHAPLSLPGQKIQVKKSMGLILPPKSAYKRFFMGNIEEKQHYSNMLTWSDPKVAPKVAIKMNDIAVQKDSFSKKLRFISTN